jgi:hypothetical protein
MNNRYEMMKYLFDIFEIYFMKNTEEMSQRSSFIKDNVSCPSVKNRNMTFKNSNDGSVQMLESNPTQEVIRTNEDDGYIDFGKMKSKDLEGDINQKENLNEELQKWINLKNDIGLSCLHYATAKSNLVNLIRE